MTIDEAKERLAKYDGDDEVYHSVFDDIIEERLMELDPEFMTQMRETYKTSGMARWCA